MWITWKDQAQALSWPLTFDQKVELFYEQSLGWQLHIADLGILSQTAALLSVRKANVWAAP